MLKISDPRTFDDGGDLLVFIGDDSGIRDSSVISNVQLCYLHDLDADASGACIAAIWRYDGELGIIDPSIVVWFTLGMDGGTPTRHRLSGVREITPGLAVCHSESNEFIYTFELGQFMDNFMKPFSNMSAYQGF